MSNQISFLDDVLCWCLLSNFYNTIFHFNIPALTLPVWGARCIIQKEST